MGDEFGTVLLSFFVFFYSLVINSVIYLSLFFTLLMNMASVSMIPSMLILQTISCNEVNFLLDNNLSSTIKKVLTSAPGCLNVGQRYPPDKFLSSG